MRSSLVATLTIYMTQTQEEHGVLLPLSTHPKERHKPATSICHIRLLSSIIYAKESDILRSKPNVVSVCGGVYRSLSFIYILS